MIPLSAAFRTVDQGCCSRSPRDLFDVIHCSSGVAGFERRLNPGAGEKNVSTASPAEVTVDPAECRLQ